MSSLIFYGRVLTAGGQPIDGAAIVISLSREGCNFANAFPLAARSDPAGAFRTDPDLAAAGAPVCVKVVAHQGTAAGPEIAKVEGLEARYPPEAQVLDSIGFVLRAVPATR